MWFGTWSKHTMKSVEVKAIEAIPSHGNFYNNQAKSLSSFLENELSVNHRHGPDSCT